MRFQETRLATLATILGVALSCHAATPAMATPLYAFSHNADAYGNTSSTNDSIGPRTSEIDYDFSGYTDFQQRNTGAVTAHVGNGTVGIDAVAANNGQYAPQRQEATGTFFFDVMFSSATSSVVQVAMNLQVSGTLDPGGFYSTVFVNAGATNNGLGYYTQHVGGGTYNETTTSVSRDGMLSGFVDDGTKQLISTGTLTLAANTTIGMYITLGTIQAYTNPAASVSFGNTLELSSVGDVFTIISGSDVTVSSVDAGIVNNRLSRQDPPLVPLPATLPMLMGCLGMMGMVTLRRRAT